MKAKNVFLLSVLFSLTSCSALLTQRSFIDQMDHQTDGFFVAGNTFDTVPGDTGYAFRTNDQIQERTPASAYDREKMEYENSIRKELHRRVKSLSQNEQRDYRRVSHLFDNDSERIYYLRLPRGERREYLFQKGLMGDSYSETRGMQFLSSRSLQRQEIQLGMTKSGVVNTWGRPVKVDIAGNPSNQNERWSFYQNGRLQYVYFENGTVQGWALD